MAAKVEEAAAVAVQGIPVYIARAASEHALASLRFAHARHADGEPLGQIPDAWLGTHVRVLNSN